jgi:DNA uptake protein ComE-like DNA-binding protein
MKKETGTRSVDMDLGWIDLNTATEDDLANIPWLGRDLARRLIEHRPFTNMDYVRKVPGVTEDIVDTLVRGGATVSSGAPSEVTPVRGGFFSPPR